MMPRLLYTCLFYLLMPLIALRLLYRSFKAPAYRQRWLERIAVFPTPDFDKPVIWIHAVSVGETIAAAPLIRNLLTTCPQFQLVVTTTTPTGSDRVKALFQETVFHVYAPYDEPLALQRFLERIKPSLLIVMETELWPNTVHQCNRHSVPVIIANARLSEKSYKGYQRLSALTQPMLAEIDHVAVQNDTDGQRFVSLGLSPDKLSVTGSIKFDLQLTEAEINKAQELRKQWDPDNQRLIYLAASTHPGEDDILLNIFKQLKQVYPSLLMVLVPRHPERFNKVFELSQQIGFKTAKRSDNSTLTQDTDVLLGDTMGELLAFYGACDVTFVGGSLVPVGGHNLIEPAAWGKAIITGSHLHNFSEISSLLNKQQGLCICLDSEALLQNSTRLIHNEQERQSMGAAAKMVAENNRGAQKKLEAIIKTFIA